MGNRKKDKKSKPGYNLDELRLLYEDFIPEAVLDYHEYDILNEPAVEQIYNSFVDESIIYGQKKLLIVTGKGELVRPHIARIAARDKRIASYQRAGYFNGQSGAFEITLK